jgi:hypothetical protein
MCSSLAVRYSIIAAVAGATYASPLRAVGAYFSFRGIEKT